MSKRNATLVVISRNVSSFLTDHRCCSVEWCQQRKGLIKSLYNRSAVRAIGACLRAARITPGGRDVPPAHVNSTPLEVLASATDHARGRAPAAAARARAARARGVLPGY